MSSENWQPEHARPEEKDAEDTQRQEFVTVAVEHINKAFCDSLKGCDPTKQAEADEIIL